MGRMTGEEFLRLKARLMDEVAVVKENADAFFYCNENAKSLGMQIEQLFFLLESAQRLMFSMCLMYGQEVQVGDLIADYEDIDPGMIEKLCDYVKRTMGQREDDKK